jgi:pimeloyl-ACP methyl ester carboxylesterase
MPIRKTSEKPGPTASRDDREMTKVTKMSKRNLAIGFARAATARRLVLIGVGLLLAVVGCASNDASPAVSTSKRSSPRTAPDGGAADGGGASSVKALHDAYRAAAKRFSMAPIDWRPCPIITDGTGMDARCADITVPLSWLAPSAGTTHVFVKHVPSIDPPKQQAWVLMGGPGYSGVALEAPASVLRGQLPTTEYFIMDYRGVGRSQRLACPSQENATGQLFDRVFDFDTLSADGMKACFDAVEAEVPLPDLRKFNTTETAMDLGMLADALRTDGAQILVYGVSFGTYVANRYLHLFPEQPGAVVLDSFVLPTGLTNHDLDADQTARDILGVCATDSDCKAHLGADPIAFAKRVIEQLGQGHCPGLAGAGIDVARFQLIAEGAVLDSAQRSFLPALYYRADRCEPADVAALVKYGTPPATAPSTVRDSGALSLLVLRSEFLDETFDDGTDTLIASSGLPAHVRSIGDAVPSYPHDAFFGEWARTDARILILQGELDSQTPPSNGNAARDHFKGPNVHFVSFPWTNHAVFNNLACGAVVATKFVANPTEAPDTSCTAQIPPPSFSVATSDAMARFGQPDLWQNATP